MSRTTVLVAMSGAAFCAAAAFTAPAAVAALVPAGHTSVSSSGVAGAAAAVSGKRPGGTTTSSRGSSGRVTALMRGRSGDGHGGEHSGGSHGGGQNGGGQNGGGQNGGGQNGGGQNGGGQNGGGQNGGGQGGCQYPPSRSPQVQLSGPSHGHAGRNSTLTGSVSTNGCRLENATVGLYSSHDGRTNWVLVQTGSVDRGGAFSFSVPGWATHYYQAVAAPGGGLSPAASNIHALPTW